MLKRLILSGIVSSLVFSLFASDYSVTIGTNTFGFAFEDTTLTTNMQARIVDDWKVMTEPWTNVTISVDYSTTNTVKGFLKFKFINHPFNFDNDNVNLSYYDIMLQEDVMNIFLCKQLTDKYIMSFMLVDSHSNKFAQIDDLITNLQHEAIMSMSSNQMVNVFYYEGVPIENYTKGAQLIKKQLLSYEYYRPSVLFYAEMPKDFLEYPEEAFWSFIPIRNNYSTWNSASISFATAIYIDGRWKIRPLPIF